MEEKPCESNSMAAEFLSGTISSLQETISSLSSDPLFSSIVALYTPILLFSPNRLFLRLLLSPVVIFTGILLLLLLRLGATQRTEQRLNPIEPHQTHESSPSVGTNSEPKPETALGSGSDPNPFRAGSFVEWNLRAPLEVIYEEYEGEEEEEEEEERGVMGMERYPPLPLYYPETDSDSSSEGEFPAKGYWDSPEGMCFRWGEEDIRDELIEIALDGKRVSQVFNVEEDNMIEIDI